MLTVSWFDNLLMTPEYMPGDEISDTCQVSMIIPEEVEQELESIDGPGEYTIRWYR